LKNPLALALALAFDWLLGEPPAPLHPVVWLGQFIGAMERHAPRDNPPAELLYGAAMTAAGVGSALLPALLLERVSSKRRDSLPLLLLSAALLKSSFAWRTLLQASIRVYDHLEAGELEQAREALRWLVSRDTTTLDEPLIAASVIESLAENASDSVVAPLFYYALFGLSGACAYRAINTLDAMLGYHGRYEHLGKVAARLDDMANLIPARLTALAITAAALANGNAPRRVWRIVQRDHMLTESPNAGYPMSAIAGALEVSLEKVGHYWLNATARQPCAADIRRASWVVSLALAGVVGGIAAVARYRRPVAPPLRLFASPPLHLFASRSPRGDDTP
jgi:adenosylcobinamide-phosphate synthase